MAEVDDWGVDGGEAQEGGEGGLPMIKGGLLDPRTFPTRWNPATSYPSMEPQAPQISGPLRTSVDDEVLQDILSAQAKLPPLKRRPETWSVNGRPYLGISASTFDPSRSNRMIVMPTPMQDAAAWAGVPQVATQSGEREQGGAIIALSAPDAADRDPISGLVTR